jgi:inner membrane protein
VDNLTHALFGASVAEVYLQKKFKHKVHLPPIGIFYFFSIAANNLPDLDLLFGLIDNTSLGYLLNHRGWTHTVVGALLQSFLLGGILWLYLKTFKRDALDFFSDLFILIFIGCQAHMLLDSFNSYGVHPFSPLSNRWHYMDTIFIIEPLLWISLIAIWIPPWRWRTLLLIPVAGAYGFGWISGFVSAGSLIFAFLFTMFCLLTLSQLHRFYRGTVGLLLFFTVVLSFWGLQHSARTKIAVELSKEKNYQTLDLVLSSLPTNPLCWFFLAPQISGENYRVVAGNISLSGDSQNCRTWPQAKGLQSLADLPASSLGELWIRNIWSTSIKDLSPLLNRCDVAAWLKFVRVPYWQNSILYDLRFAFRNEDNFTTLNLNQSPEPHCPPVPAPWTPPRQDLIDHTQKQPVN